VYEWANLSNKLYLIRKLYQTKFSPGQDMSDHQVYSTNDRASAWYWRGDQGIPYCCTATRWSSIELWEPGYCSWCSTWWWAHPWAC